MIPAPETGDAKVLIDTLMVSPRVMTQFFVSDMSRADEVIGRLRPLPL